MTDDSCNLSIRVLRSLVDRLDTLIPHLADDPRMHVLGRVSRSDVARAAMVLGLEALEVEYALRTPRAREAGVLMSSPTSAAK